MSADAAPAPVATEAPAPAVETASPAPEVAKTEPAEDPDARLSPIARFAKGARERKGAKLAAAGKPVETPASAKPATEPATAKAGDKAPERGPDGKFLPADGKPAAAKPAEDSPKVEAAVAKAEDAGVEVPEQKKSQTDAQYLNQITRLMRENKQAKAEALEHKTAREKAEERATRADKTRDRLSGKEIDEEAFIEATGRTFEAFVRAIAKGDAEGGAKFKPKANLPPELAEMKAAVEAQLAEIKAHKEEQAASKKAAEESEAKTKAEAERAATLKADHDECDGWLKDAEQLKKFPRLAALAKGAEHLRDEIYSRWPGFKGPQPDIAEVAQSLESTLKDRTSSIFANEAVILEMLSDPKMREMVSRALSAQPNAIDNQPSARDHGQTKTAKVEGPPTLSQKVSQEAPAPVVTTKTLSSDEREEEERVAYHARMRAWAQARTDSINARSSRS